MPINKDQVAQICVCASRS